MLEDKLTQEQRIRLEAVAQAVAMQAMRPDIGIQAILEQAKAIETYVKEGMQDG